MDLSLRVALAHAGRRVELDATELEARLAVPGLAASLLQVFIRSVGVGGSKNLPGSPVTLNASHELSGDPGGINRYHGGNDDYGADDPVDKLASHLADALDDPNGLAWYRKVAREVPQQVVLDALGRARDLRRADVRRSRAALFTAIIRPHLNVHESYAHQTSSPTRAPRDGHRPPTTPSHVGRR